MRTPIGSTVRRLILAATLAASVVAGLTSSQQAHAAITACRTDPIIWLDTGVKVDLTATIYASRNDINHIEYVLHTPAGSNVSKIVYTGGELGHKESVQIIADSASGIYNTATWVDTASSGVSVETQMTVLDRTTSTKLADEVSGYDHMELHSHVQLGDK